MDENQGITYAVIGENESNDSCGQNITRLADTLGSLSIPTVELPPMIGSLQVLQGASQIVDLQDALSYSLAEKMSEAITPLMAQTEALREISESGIASLAFQSETIKKIDVASTLFLDDQIKNLQSISLSAMTDLMSPQLEAIKGASESLIESIDRVTKRLSNDSLSLVADSISNALKFDYSALFHGLENLSDLFHFDIPERISIDAYKNRFNSALFSARWFPFVAQCMPMRMLLEINEVILHTREKSKSRADKLDKVIFKYFDDVKIKEVKRGWKELELLPFENRILCQAVEAYRRREYAITTIVLSTFWEKIVAEKAGRAEEYRTIKKATNNFEVLVEQNELPQLYNQFFKEYIMYNCCSEKEVKKDVPGRHGMAHGWFSAYPTRKAALNAIIFTDFLLNLEPVYEKMEE